MPASSSSASAKLHVVIAGGGVAALEALLALAELAPEHARASVITPNEEFVYRPLAVREPFAYGPARRYQLEPIVRRAGGELRGDEVAWIDPQARTVHSKAGAAIEYGALLIALGARANRRYKHALTIDDRRLDETMHGLIQDVEAGYLKRLAFVAPGRLAWPLPMYELALMTTGRAYDSGIELAVTIVTPEEAPLAVLGQTVSAAVSERLERAGVEVLSSAFAEIPAQREVVVNPGSRTLHADRVIALPELFGPSLRGVPLGEYGFIPVDAHARVAGVGPIFAAGDATEFPVKHGGIAAQQADVAAHSIAVLAGAEVKAARFQPTFRGIMLTDSTPLYLSARLAGARGFEGEAGDKPTWSPASKISANYLQPTLEEIDA